MQRIPALDRTLLSANLIIPYLCPVPSLLIVAKALSKANLLLAFHFSLFKTKSLTATARP